MFNEHVPSSETPEPPSNDALKAAFLAEQAAYRASIIEPHFDELEKLMKGANPIVHIALALRYYKLLEIITSLPDEYLRNIGARHIQQSIDVLLKQGDETAAFRAAHPDITLP